MTESETPANGESDVLPESAEEITLADITSNLELGCWCAVVLIPILYYVNGPAVSQDQFVVRCILAGLAYTGAPVLRWYHWRQARKPNAKVSGQTERS